MNNSIDVGKQDLTVCASVDFAITSPGTMGEIIKETIVDQLNISLIDVAVEPGNYTITLIAIVKKL